MDAFNYNDKTFELFIKSNKQYTPYPGGFGKCYFDRINELIAGNNDCIAQIDASTDTKQTYKELLSASIKLAQYLRSINIQPGDHINLCSYNHINAAVVVLATQFVGAVLSATDPIQSLEDLKYLLNLVKPKIVFVSDGSEDIINTCLNDIELPSKSHVIMVTHSVHNEFETVDDILKKTTVGGDFAPHFVEDSNATCFVLFSSGTTGMPKAICLNHNYMFAQMSLYPKASLNWVMLNYVSFYWLSGVFLLAMSIRTGSAKLVCRKFEKSTHWQTVAKYKVNHLMLSNTYFIEANKYLDANTHLPKLNILVIVGGLVPLKELNYFIEKLPNVEVRHMYALTEGGLIAQSKRGDKIGSNGKPLANDQTIKVVDPDTDHNLPLKEIGEIRVKRQYQMTGYFKMDSTDVWDSQGFLKTGDLGYLDDEFNLYVVDRIKEMFKYRSWHVVPAKVENALSTHPDVVHAVVIGKPTHDEDENHALAIVNLREGSQTTGLELQNFVNDRMDEIHQIRAGVIIVDASEIPITPTGKVNRRQLKRLYAN